MFGKVVCYVGIHGNRIGFKSVSSARKFIIDEYRNGRRFGGGTILKGPTGHDIYGMVEYCEPYD